MASIIQLLPDHVANQIAAGEVVQRPASVVKELLENALDAEATLIEVLIREAGRNLIQVVDNGKGMSTEDAAMAFARHATSKIRTTEDIFNIVTKGFRGEALASIGAVAQVELKTKLKGEALGTTLYMEGGKIMFQEPSQCQEGTSIAVKNLFFNVPARRKFLKNNHIEFRHIMDEFQRVALAHEDTEFDLFHNDEPVFRLRKGSLLQRILDVFGRKLQPHLVPVQEDLGWVKLTGFVGKPEAAKKNRGEQFFFVNHRFFKSPYLNRAVQEAFDGLLLAGYSPTYFLYLEIQPDKIDVNIHPQKTEVKFEDENLIFALLRSTIKKSLGIYHVAPSLNFDAPNQFDGFLHASPSKSQTGNVRVPSDFNPFSQEQRGSQAEYKGLENLYQASVEAAPSRLNLFQEEDFEEDLMRLPNAYWLLNKEGKTLMIDPGRMYRLVYSEEKTEGKLSSESHALLFSVEYHMNEQEKHQYKSLKKYLPTLGYQVEMTHDNTLSISAVPEGLKETKIHRFFEKLFEIRDIHSEEEFMEAYQERWRSVQMKSRFDFLYKAEVESLLKDFQKLGFPEYLPNGKRCFLELNLDELKNKF